MSRKENIAFIIEKAAKMDDTQLAALLAGRVQSERPAATRRSSKP